MFFCLLEVDGSLIQTKMRCGAGTQWRNVWWIRQGAPTWLLLLGAVTYDDTFLYSV